MTKQEIKNMAERMTNDLSMNFSASGDGLDRVVESYLMDVIRQTEDEVKSITYDLIAKIGDKRKG